MAGKINSVCLESILDYAKRIAMLKEAEHNCWVHNHPASCDTREKLQRDVGNMRSDILHTCSVK